jgi:hypothetical protein
MMWTLELEDGRKVLVHHLITGTARASLLNRDCYLSLDDGW